MRALTVASCAAVDDDGIDHINRAQKAGSGQIFLLAVVVGHAVGDQTDARGNAGQCCPLHAQFIEQTGSCTEDRLTLLLKAGCLRRAGGRRNHGGMSQVERRRGRSFGQSIMPLLRRNQPARWSTGGTGQSCKCHCRRTSAGKIRLGSRMHDSRPNRRRWIH